MKHKNLIFFLLLIPMIFGCSKEEKEEVVTYSKPEVTTSEILEIAGNTITCTGKIISDGGTKVISKGMVWHTEPNVTLFNKKGRSIETSETDKYGKFESIVTDLIPNTKYYYRAYATNKIGTTYGEEKEFTTKIIPVNIEMVTVKGGTFKMGSSNKYDNAEPVHSVTLSSFEISKHEVTEAQWKAVMGNVFFEFEGDVYREYKGDNFPITQVSWDIVQTFIARLNEQSGKNYRLPTEAEWEFAARGGISGSSTTYSGSNTLEDVAWYCDNSDKTIHEVGTKQANELGIFDMSGNAYEWCSDWYAHYHSDSCENPQGPEVGTRRVLRGGSWFSDPSQCTVARRGSVSQDWYYNDIGFRLVRSL